VPPASAFQRTPRISSNLLSKQLGWTKGCRIVFGFFLPQVFFWVPFALYLPCICNSAICLEFCNSFELEPVILHGICYILAWSLCILHGICYMWPCPPSILHGICHVLALQPGICMVFATFWYFNRSFRVSFRVSLGFHLGFHLWFHLGLHLGYHLGFHLGFL